jgi:hypothetical protein
MAKVSVSAEYSSSADKVWGIIGSFDGLAAWHPVIETCTLEDGGNNRRLTLGDGAQLLEKLISHDDSARTYTYSILESPLPFSDYVSTVKVSQSDDGCTVDWSSEFTPGGPEDEVCGAVQGIYQAGLDNLKSLL